MQSRLSDLETRFSECHEELARLRSAEQDTEHDQLRHDEFIPIFKDVCALIREAELANAPYLAELTKLTGDILNNELRYALGGDSEDEMGLFTLMPSWAHDDLGDRPMIGIKMGDNFHFFIELFRPMFAEGVTGDFIRNQYRKDPWHPSMKRHPKSTRMARFRPDLPSLTPTSENSITASILDARCEVFPSPCVCPIKFHISPSCLALLGTAGYKNRSPYLEYIILTKPMEPLVDFPDDYSVGPGLAGVASHAAIDDSRRLIFVGDNHRVKSYEWGSTEEIHKKPRPVHTLDSESAKGAMTLLPNGSLARAGKGGASVWDLQAIPTHGPNGKAIIGETVQEFDSWRDESEIERSSGSLPSSRIKFFDHPNFEPNLWQPLISNPSQMLCAERARRSGNYNCIGIDLETGKTASCYLGHGDEITCSYMDRVGGHHDYRYAKIPKSQRSDYGDDEDEDEDDEDAGTDGQRCWPKDAWHTEDYFGYLFDAGDHSIIRYTFKEDPNPSVVPLYGNASVGGHWPW
ncbi:hypothetical protein FRC11_007772 [Ceratobasidium sp. 423]|nr:hypothetical protein FRC11_007772 [Ceratobasidium sp. 423]